MAPFTDLIINVEYHANANLLKIAYVGQRLKEWNMFQIFSCHLISIFFRSDKHRHLDWSI